MASSEKELVHMMNYVPDDIFMLALEYKIKEEQLKKLCQEKNILFYHATDAIWAAKELNKLDNE